MSRIVVTGAAGLVGQNLIPRLKTRGHELVAIDKHPTNTAVLRRLHPDVTVIEADMAEAGDWQDAVAGCEVVISGHAQIGGLDPEAFKRNNVTATHRLLEAARKDAYLVQMSSSVVESAANDWYTESKAAQEEIAVASGLPCAVLRPTLMFGWFDRKHVGWLARFMRKVPVFPIPGDGRYLRQPLYAGDFASVIAACVDRRPVGVWNITGLEKIDYVDLMREVKAATAARTPIVNIPYGLFWLLLKTYALVDRDPPFTVKQLKALVTPDVFEVIDWPGVFGVTATPLRQALVETFRDPVYSDIVLDF
jgi:nucleoside-diphosphate-sugar epimerase